MLRARGIEISGQLGVLVSLLFAALGVAACTHPQQHVAEFHVAPPDCNAVEVCHAYTCQMKSTFYFHPKDIAEIAAMMKKTKRADTPFEERRAIAYAMGLIETKVGAKLGINDRAGMEFGGSGDPTQEDCVDEATKTTSFLLVLQTHGLIKYHTVGTPFSKEALIWATLHGDPVAGEGDRPEICRGFLERSPR